MSVSVRFGEIDCRSHPHLVSKKIFREICGTEA